MKYLRFFQIGLLLLKNVFSVLIPTSSILPPFGSFDSSGKRRVKGWRIFGTARVKMGAVALTSAQKNENGSVWSTKAAVIKDEFSVEIKFRISGTKPKEGGESLTFFIVNDRTFINESDFFGGPRRFQGLAFVISFNNDKPKNNAIKDPQKMAVYVNNAGPEPVEVASCLKSLYYDENRDDFVPSHASTMRITYRGGSLVVDVDLRNTQRWYRCFSTNKINTIIPDTATNWRDEMIIGIVGNTGSKQTRFEVMSFKLYDQNQEATELADSDWNGEDGDRALKIAHQLEHNLFEVKDTIEHMLDQLGEKAQRDVERIDELEKTLQHSALSLMESRIQEVENRLTSLSTPMVEARVKQVEYRTNHRLEAFKHETDSGTFGWVKPFLVILVLIIGFALYSHREYKSMNKWNKNLMSKTG